MDDERAGGRSSFYSVNTRYRVGVERIRAETVNRFGGEGDKPAGAEKPRGLFDFASVGHSRPGLGHERL
jgi:hypothetical protein